MKTSTLMIWFGALALSACASTAPPTARVSSSEDAVRAARELGAEQEPTATLHLDAAEEQLAHAKRLMGSGENEKAAWLLARAEADANLSIALTREAKNKRAAQDAEVQIQNLSGAERAREPGSAP